MKRIKAALFFCITLIIFFSCQVDLPIVEMTRARLSMKMARDVQAEKYAPTLLENSEKHLYKCHDFVVKEDIDDAKKEALISFKLANDAINKSLPLLANDTITEAQAVHLEAQNLYAEKFAPEDYSSAGTLLEQAKKENGEKLYRKSINSSKEAITKAGSAKQAALDKIPDLEKQTDDLSKERDDLMAMEGNDLAKDELIKAGESLTKAKESIGEKKLKDVYDNNESASTDIASARKKIVNTTAKQKISTMRLEVQNLKDKRGTEFAGDDLEVAVSSLNEAESMLEEERHEETLAKISEAETALGKARKMTKKGVATEKITATELLYEKTEKKSYAKRMKNKLDEASTLIAAGKGHLEAEEYDNTIQKADEAESILNAITLQGEKNYGSSIYGSEEGGGKTYIVRYRKRNTDCLWRIAHKVYRNAKLWPLIYMANKNLISDPDLIFPGQQFRIPPIPKKNKMETDKEMSNDGNSIENKSEGASDTVDNKNQKNGLEVNRLQE